MKGMHLNSKIAQLTLSDFPPERASRFPPSFIFPNSPLHTQPRSTFYQSPLPVHLHPPGKS
jgi:hypothetical protein